MVIDGIGIWGADAIVGKDEGGMTESDGDYRLMLCLLLGYVSSNTLGSSEGVLGHLPDPTSPLLDPPAPQAGDCSVHIGSWPQLAPGPSPQRMDMWQKATRERY